MAWLPRNVIDEANWFLRKFEQTHSFSQLSLWSLWVKVEEKIVYRDKESEIENEIKKIDLNNLTPIQALNILSELKSKV